MMVRAHAPGHAVRGTRSRRGLSLIEVLMSLAIFLMSLVALTQLVDLGGQRAIDMQWTSLATTIAQSNMDKVIAGALPLTGLPETTSDEDQDWLVSVSADAESTPGLYLVTVTVGRDRPGGSRFETKLTQYVLDPAQRGSTTGTDADTSTTTGGGGL